MNYTRLSKEFSKCRNRRAYSTTKLLLVNMDHSQGGSNSNKIHQTRLIKSGPERDMLEPGGQTYFQKFGHQQQLERIEI